MLTAVEAQGELAKILAGPGVHAMRLDRDVGSLLHIYKLQTSMRFLKTRGLLHPVSAAELEMLNLIGDGDSCELISLPVEYCDKTRRC